MNATVWVLDVAHRAQRLACEVPADRRPLAAATELVAQALGLTFACPAGVRARGDQIELVFLHPRPGEGPAWMPLAAWTADDAAFELYVDVMLGGWRPPTRALDVFFFGDTPELAALLAHLVVKGVKRGTTSWIAAAEREGGTIPHAGLVSIVTDGFGYPACAIESVQVERMPFREIDAERAFIEGEGDRSLEDYREVHLRYYAREAQRLGLTFTEDEPVSFERFRVLALLGRADAP
jgi:uncharacterized protein YhfF